MLDNGLLLLPLLNDRRCRLWYEGTGDRCSRLIGICTVDGVVRMALQCRLVSIVLAALCLSMCMVLRLGRHCRVHQLLARWHRDLASRSWSVLSAMRCA